MPKSRKITIGDTIARCEWSQCMSNYPVKVKRGAVRPASSKAIDVQPAESSGNVFASFRYSYAEISMGGGKAHVRSKHAQFENGKLTLEAFEGEVDPRAYERTIAEAQRYFAAQAALFLRPFAAFLPFIRQPRDRE
jgi:hypothetical protein